MTKRAVPRAALVSPHRARPEPVEYENDLRDTARARAVGDILQERRAVGCKMYSEPRSSLCCVRYGGPARAAGKDARPGGRGSAKPRDSSCGLLTQAAEKGSLLSGENGQGVISELRALTGHPFCANGQRSDAGLTGSRQPGAQTPQARRSGDIRQAAGFGEVLVDGEGNPANTVIRRRQATCTYYSLNLLLC